jgi:hypothetical protein
MSKVRGNRKRWVVVLRLAVAIGLAIAAHALHAGSASAATPAAVRGAADASGGSPITLAGFTSQRFPVFFKVSADGKMLLTGGIGIAMTCASGVVVGVPDLFARVPIHASGRLHASYASPTILQNGTSYTSTDALTARLGPKHSQMTGTWRLAVTYGFADGTSDHCDSGPVTFKATS